MGLWDFCCYMPHHWSISAQMSDESQEMALRQLARLIVSSSVVLSLFLFPGNARLVSRETPDHPSIDPKDIKSETCLRCHPDKNEGKFVHSAIAAGCESCHQATSEGEKTTITPVATGGDLCALCHEVKKDPVLHGPYKTGQCLVCHDPHRSEFPHQARAEPNTLCMSCHGVNQPDVKVNPATKTVTLLGSQTLDFDDYRQAMKIPLDRSGTSGHPIMGHPLTGKDPRRKDAALTCLSCHTPHSSALEHLMPPNIKLETGLCGQCHE